jgi:hypothetical protein
VEGEPMTERRKSPRPRTLSATPNTKLARMRAQMLRSAAEIEAVSLLLERGQLFETARVLAEHVAALRRAAQ